MFLVGGSEGAVVANILASQLSYVNATVSLNSGAPKFIDDVLHNIESQSPYIEAYIDSSNGFIKFTTIFSTANPII